MPLPVEKSAGKVSSLVARWQTAANKEQEQAARARDSESRRSSTSASRRSSENYSVRPSPRVEGQMSLPTVGGGEEGVEELKDFEEKARIEDGGKKAAEPEKIGGAGSAVTRARGRARLGDEKKSSPTNAKQETKGTSKAETTNGTPTKSKQETARTPASPRSTTKPRPPSLQSPAKAATSQGPKASSPSTNMAKPPSSSPTMSRIPVAAKQGQAGSTSSTRTRTVSGSARVVKSKPDESSDVKSLDSPARSPTTKTSQSTSGKGAAEPSRTAAASAQSPAKAAAIPPSTTKAAASPAKALGSKTTPSDPPKPASTETPHKPAVNSTTKARTITPASTSKPSKAPPSSFSRTSGSRLTPSHTGPVRASSTTPGGRNPVSPTPTPLRPHITGTPSKPTASSLAKAKEAAEKRKSLSLGKASGIVARQSLSKPQPRESTTTSVPATTAAPKITAPSSASRLMQGTASSRAKAASATAAPPSPTRAKVVKPTSTPSKATPARTAASAKSTPSKTSINVKSGGETNGEKQEVPRGAAQAEDLASGSGNGTTAQNATAEGPDLTPSTPPPAKHREQFEEEPVEDPIIEPHTAETEIEETKVSGDGTGPERSAIIGRVGLAGAREAPNGIGSDQQHSKVDVLPDANATNGVSDDNIPDDSSPQHRLVNPDDINESGEVEEPEMPRSAPSPSPFGRIGHPGAGKHELESGNPTAVKEDKEDKGTEGKREIKWNEEELKRDPAKTITAPDSKRKE